MTLVLALRCSDGVIMAADSQATEGTLNVRFPVQKLFPLTSRAAWGSSGTGQIAVELRGAFEQARDYLEKSPDLDSSLISLIRPILQKHYSWWLAEPPQIKGSSPATFFLAAGADERGVGWIIEVDPRCVLTHYEARGFHAVGSGAEYALFAGSVLSHFEVMERPLDHGELLAHRVMSSAIDTSAYGIGHPIQMWLADGQGARELSRDEIDRHIADAVEGWREVERSALDDFMSPPPVPPPLPPKLEGNEATE